MKTTALMTVAVEFDSNVEDEIIEYARLVIQDEIGSLEIIMDDHDPIRVRKCEVILDDVLDGVDPNV